MSSYKKNYKIQSNNQIIRYNQYEICRYNLSFKAEVLELLRSLWSTSLHTNCEYLNWKYATNPYAKSPIIHMALYEGKVVGVRGYYQSCWEVGGSKGRIICLSDADAIVHPDHRQRGLLEMMTKIALAELELSDYEYIFTLSASPHTYKNNLKLGWKSAGNVGLAWRKKKNRTTLYSINPLPPNDELNPFYFFDQFKERNHFDITSQIVLSDEPRPKEMAEVVGRISTDGRIRHVRDLDYFAWRFQNPLNEYRFLFLGNNPLEGYLILQSSKKQRDKSICIVDWEAVSNEIRFELLKTSLCAGKFDEVTIWTSTLSKETRSLLQEVGFEMPLTKTDRQSIEYEPSILVKRLHSKTSPADWRFMGIKLLEQDNWDLRAIYSDGY